MKHPLFLIFVLLIIGFQAIAQQKSMTQLLGYPEDTKLLILHADDLGVAHSENSASIAGLEKSPLNSASIMVPCPWFPEIAAYARKNKQEDFGLHLTLTSEWKNYKWGPVTSLDSVPSLVNENGYFYSSVDSLQKYASPEEVEIELRNQVKKAYKFGIDVTHLDVHMGAGSSTAEFAAAYIKIGKEFGLPVLLDKRVYAYGTEVKNLLDDNSIIVDQLLSMEPKTYKMGAHKFYSNLLKKLEPGLNFLLVHLAYDDAEMRAITIDHPDYGAEWRQADFDFVTSKACASILKEQNIKLITWRELRDKVVRGK